MALPVLCSYLSLFSLSLDSLSVLFMLSFCSCFCSFLFALAFFSFFAIFSPLFYILLLFLLFFCLYSDPLFFHLYLFLFIYLFIYLFSLLLFSWFFHLSDSFTTSVKICFFPTIFQLRNRTKINSSRVPLFL